MRKRFAVLAVVALAACGDASGPVYGGSVTLGNGSVQTFAQFAEGGAPIAVGVTFTAGVLVGLPAADTFMTVELPDGGAGTIFTHAFVDFVPHGHEPVMVYDTAHFDFHFYLVPAADREAIQAGVDSTPPAPELVPPNHRKVTESVTRMGTHWADSTGPEFMAPGGFQRSMVYGYNDGAFKFYDIMITRQWLLSQPTETVTFDQPATFPGPGYYPTRFTVSYDAQALRYRVALEGFVQR